MTIRHGVTGDLAGMVALLYDGRTSPSQLERDTWSEMIGRNDITVFVADVAGEIVGTATFLVLASLSYDCRPSAFIEAMRFRHAHRRKGIARRILEVLLEEARDLGCHKIQLLAHKRHANDGAHALYRSIGFEEEAAGFRLYL